MEQKKWIALSTFHTTDPRCSSNIAIVLEMHHFLLLKCTWKYLNIVLYVLSWSFKYFITILVIQSFVNKPYKTQSKQQYICLSAPYIPCKFQLWKGIFSLFLEQRKKGTPFCFLCLGDHVEPG